MRHRHFGSLLFLAGFAVAACGGASFEAGVIADAGDDGGSSTTPDDGSADTGVTHVVGPPAHADAGKDAADHADGATDATLDAGEPGEASADAGPDAGPCPSTQKLCGDTCVSITSPVTGCADTSCTPCSLPNATATCNTSGACAVGACNAGFEHCTGPTSGGCETSITTATNCGSCTNACTIADPDCAASGATWMCTSGCSGSNVLCNSACVDESTSTADCGGCTSSSKSYACTAPANGAATCTSGACGFTCNANFTACNGNACDSLTTDTSNCGACNHACPVPTNGVATCAPVAGVGTCGISCDSGYQLCNGACVQADPSAAFVSSSSSATSGCGAIGAPCGTITAGIAYAVAEGKTHVYVDHGTYEEQVTLTKGLTVEGGWIYGGAGAWTKECSTGTDPSSVTIIAPTAASIAVLAKDVTATLTNISVHNQTTAAAGESIYGIFAASTGTTNDTSLTLNAVEITVAAGGGGSSGSTDTPPGLPASNVPPCAASDGKAGATVAAGTTSAGSYGSSGFVPGAGTAGQVGNAGDNGTTGAAGTCAPSTTCDTSAGGCQPAVTVCGGQGAPGCGGSGGARGLGGGGGGASIALFVWKATVAVNGGSFASQNGGPGGAGGSAGSPVTAPTTGATGSFVNVASCTQKPAGQCTGSTKSEPYGGAGTTGGAGSTGGAGAAGAGGDSYAYYTGGAGTVTTSGTPTFTFGSGGTSPAGATYGGHAAAHD